MNQGLLTIGAALAFLLASCTVGQEYQTPPAGLPAAWHGSVEGEQGIASNVDLGQWWTSFNDPFLSRLIAEAMSANLDLRQATGRLREARARLQGVNASLAPTVDAHAKAMHQRTSKNFSLLTQRPGTELEGDFFDAGFDASWELDLFGGVRRNLEAAEADAQAAEEGRRDVLVSLLAEVGRTYVQLRSLQERLGLAHDNLIAQTETLHLAQVRFAAGLTTDLDVAQAEALAASTRALIPALEAQAEQSMYRLSLLIGREPTALLAELGEPRPVPKQKAMAGVPLGLPADLLQQRPDIRASERQLAAAVARQGMAEADLFPRFFLTGSTGLQSIESDIFFTSASRFYSIGPSIRWPVLDFGRIRANIAAQDARAEQALAVYEKTILTALTDVESTLVALDKEAFRHQALSETVEANQRALALALDRYRQGLAAYLTVLDSQRQLLAAEDQLAQSAAALVLNRLGLYKALGGGWSE